MRVQSRGVAQAYGGCEFAGAARTVWRSRRGGVRSVPCDASVLVMRLGGTILLPGTRGVHVSEGTSAARSMQQG